VSRRLLVFNAAVGLLACLLAAGLIRELLATRPLPPPPPPRAVAASPAPAATGPDSPPASYGVIAAKSLFSPGRSEAPVAPAIATGPRPLLHGVVVDGPKSRAYLEDPQVKRTFGYAVGDPVGGGRVEAIGPDRVVITRADGRLEVLLQDPAKPKVAPPPTPAAPAAATPAAGASPTSPAPPPSRTVGPGSRVSER
jgi:hypothetical protein